MQPSKHAAIVVDGKAYIFDVAHIVSGDSFDDEALQYMAERTGAVECDGVVFGDSYDVIIAWANERRIPVAV